MREQKRNDKESMICLTPKPSQSFFVYRIQSKEKIFTENTVIKKDLTISIRKHANELKVHKKTVRTAIKLDLIRDLNPLDYSIWGILESKINKTCHPNIGSLKTATEEEWNKMSKEFILKACKSF